MSTLPIFGPTEVQNVDDDLGPAVAIVRVDFALSREELQTALAYGYASANQDCPVEDMTAEDVRREVEGHLAFAGYVKLTRHVESERVRSDKDPVRDAAFEAAIDRAYPSSPARPAVQAPVYGPGTVTLQTLDRGEVVVDEPAWCLGHDGETVGHRADITHNGAWTAAGVDVDGDRVEFLRARISHAPLTELAIEPHPVADVEDVGALDSEQLRALAAEVGRHSGRLYAKANELDGLRRAEA